VAAVKILTNVHYYSANQNAESYHLAFSYRDENNVEMKTKILLLLLRRLSGKQTVLFARLFASWQLQFGY
jgi:hypothetical protein